MMSFHSKLYIFYVLNDHIKCGSRQIPKGKQGLAISLKILVPREGKARKEDS